MVCTLGQTLLLGASCTVSTPVLLPSGLTAAQLKCQSNQLLMSTEGSEL